MNANWFLRFTVLGLLIFCSQAIAASPEILRSLVLQAPPAASVNSVTVSPDGSLVATAANEGGVRLYDAKTGEMLRVIGDAGDRSVVFSPDGRSLAAAGFHMDKVVELCDVRTGKILRTFAGHSQIETCATVFSPDGKLLASAGRDSEIRVWDVATGTLRHRIEGTPAIALAFAPDSRTLASGGCDKTIRLWNADTGHLRRLLKRHSDCVTTLAFSPDGKSIASGSCDWVNHRGRNTAEFAWRDPGCDSQWKLWDTTSGELKRTVTEPGRLLSLAFAPDGKSLACAIGKDIRLYDLRAESPGRVVTSYDFDATSVAFTPDGAAVISGNHDQTVKRVSLATGKVEWHAPGSCEQVNSVVVSPDGSLLATGSSDRRFAVRTLKASDHGVQPGAVRLWDARTGRLLRRLGDPTDQVMAVAISPDGKRVASGGASARGSGVVRLCEAATGAALWSVDDHAAEVLAVAFAPNGSRLASAAADGLIKLRDPRTGSVVRTFGDHQGGATSLAFSADGATLVCGEGQGGTRVWDVHTGRLLHTCKAAESQAGTVTTDRMFTTVAFDPDGATFLACAASVGNTYGEPLRLWNARTGELNREFDEPRIGGRPFALSPDGSILATGGKTIQLWDVKSGKTLRRLIGYLKKTQSITFSPDGRLIYSGGSYGTTNVWEVATGRHLVTLFAFAQRSGGAATDDWLAHTNDGFYCGSPGVERYLAWRVGGELQTPDSLGQPFHRADRVAAALKVDSDR